MRHETYTGVKLGDFNVKDEGYLADALKGYWARKWEDKVRLTVVRGHALLSSDIVAEDTVINMALPEHKPFYANVLSETSSRRILVDSNQLKTILHSGEQIQAVFTVEV